MKAQSIKVPVEATPKYIEAGKFVECFGNWYTEEGTENGFVGTIKDLVKQMPAADVEPRWIPVTERLPREYTRVIGYMAWKAMTAIEYQNGRWYSIDHLEPLPDEAVSHWMPLPKPPKEGENERT